MSLIPLGFWAASGGGAAGGFDLLESEILTSSASSVTFTGLDAYSDYEHLQIRFTDRADSFGTITSTNFRLNSDSGTNYDIHQLFGDGSSPPRAVSVSSNRPRAPVAANGIEIKSSSG